MCNDFSIILTKYLSLIFKIVLFGEIQKKQKTDKID